MKLVFMEANYIRIQNTLVINRTENDRVTSILETIKLLERLQITNYNLRILWDSVLPSRADVYKTLKVQNGSIFDTHRHGTDHNNE